MQIKKLTIPEKYELLKLRVQWGDYAKIGRRFGISPKAASQIHSNIKRDVVDGNFYGVNKISDATGESKNDIVELINFRIKKGIKNPHRKKILIEQYKGYDIMKMVNNSEYYFIAKEKISVSVLLLSSPKAARNVIDTYLRSATNPIYK